MISPRGFSRIHFVNSHLIETDGGRIKGKISLYCNALDVTRQGFYWFLKHRDDPWKYDDVVEKMREIIAEDECNDTYGRVRMRQALELRYPDDDIPCERTVYRIMEKAGLCTSTVANAYKAFPGIRGAIIHSEHGSQYTSALYRAELKRCGIVQSMNSDGGRCHDNARCEAMWARMKDELIYGRYDTKKMTVDEIKTLIWRYFIIYWNNRRICSANGGLPPMVKRQRYYASLNSAA